MEKPGLSWTAGDGTKLVYSDLPPMKQEVLEEMVVEESVIDTDENYVVYIMDENNVGSDGSVNVASAGQDGENVVMMDEGDLSSLITQLGASNVQIQDAGGNVQAMPPNINIKQEPETSSPVVTANVNKKRKLEEPSVHPSRKLARAPGRGPPRCVGPPLTQGAQPKRHQCLSCLRVFLHSSTIALHASLHAKDKQIMFKCMVCYLTFPSADLVKHHTNTVHKEDRHHECHSCQKRFTMPIHLAFHRRAMHTTGISCHRCFKHFSSSSLRKRHLMFCRAGIRHYNCHICGVRLRSRRDLKQHIRGSHLNLPTTLERGKAIKLETVSGGDGRDDVIQVMIDGEIQHDDSWMEEYGDQVQVIELADGETIDDHMQLKWHRVGEEMDEEDIDEMDQMIHSEANSHNRAVSKKTLQAVSRPSVFQCVACNFQCKEIVQIRTHVVIHESERNADGTRVVFLCNLCGRTFRTKQHIENHSKKHAIALQRFYCDICEKGFSSATTLNDHMGMHNVRSKVKCNECNKLFATEKNLQQHMILHQDVDPYCCDICGKSFKKKHQFDVHMMRHGTVPMPYQCPVCEKSFLTSKQLHLHAAKFHGNTEGAESELYSCHTCDKSFKTISDVLSHASSHGNDVKKFQCDQCTRSFTSKQALINHVQKHEECPHQCERCSKMFTNIEGLIIHMKKCLARDLSHKVSRPHKCHECPRSFCSSQGLYKHRRYYHNVAATTRRGRKPLNRSPTHNKAYPCTHCGITVVGEQEFRTHMEQHVARVMYVCGTCDEQFTSEARLKFHMAAHSGCLLYKCGICRTAAFSTSAQLKEHIDKHGERGARFCCECGFCGKLCTYVSLLIKHIKMHTDEKEYKCEECGKMLRNITTYRTHMMRHKGNFRYPCSQCPKKFLFRGDLEKHMEKHQDSRPYKCDQCNKVYSSKYSLFEHKRSHTGIYPYVCNTCGKGFSFPSHYEYHIRKHVLDQTVDKLIPPPPHVLKNEQKLAASNLS